MGTEGHCTYCKLAGGKAKLRSCECDPLWAHWPMMLIDWAESADACTHSWLIPAK